MTGEYSRAQHLMMPWFSTPKVRPSLGVLLSNSHAADAAAVHEGFALLNISRHASCSKVIPGSNQLTLQSCHERGDFAMPVTHQAFTAMAALTPSVDTLPLTSRPRFACQVHRRHSSFRY
jgi:hypothetical protein